MTPSLPIAVIIVAAGSASRFGQPKQLVPLGGLPVFLHSVKAFLPHAMEMVVLTPPGKEKEYQTLTCKYGIDDAKLRFTSGGATRADSVRNGLDALTLQEGIVAIHDAARPLVSAELLLKLADTANQFGGAAPATPLADTLLAADANGMMTGTVPRDGLWRVATPQVFQLAPLRQAYSSTTQTLTDDTQVFFNAGGQVKLLPAGNECIKVTYPDDLALAERLFNQLKRIQHQ